MGILIKLIKLILISVILNVLPWISNPSGLWQFILVKLSPVVSCTGVTCWIACVKQVEKFPHFRTIFPKQNLPPNINNNLSSKLILWIIQGENSSSNRLRVYKVSLFSDGLNDFAILRLIHDRVRLTRWPPTLWCPIRLHLAKEHSFPHNFTWNPSSQKRWFARSLELSCVWAIIKIIVIKR